MTHLNLLVIRSADIDAAARLYEALGLQFQKHSHGNGPLHYACSDEGSVFEIYPLANAQPPTTSARLGFEVDSVSRAVESVQKLGGRVLASPHLLDGVEQAVVTDLDGHKIELRSASTR